MFDDLDRFRTKDAWPQPSTDPANFDQSALCLNFAGPTKYKSLADIERGFKVLKSDIEIGPVHHRLPDRIRAHALICFIALVIQRVMRDRLRQTPVADVVSPERALSILRRIQTHRVEMLKGQSVTGISTIDALQQKILNSLKVEKPTASAQYACL